MYKGEKERERERESYLEGVGFGGGGGELRVLACWNKPTVAGTAKKIHPVEPALINHSNY